MKKMSKQAMNDPSTPNINERNNIPSLPQAPTDPLRTIISSEVYIESLEKKLNRLKGKQTENVKASDMINTLQAVKEGQLAQMLTTNQNPAYSEEEYGECDTTSFAFSLQRKLNPDKQALNPQELMPLVSNDVLAKVAELNDSNNDGTELT